MQCSARLPRCLLHRGYATAANELPAGAAAKSIRSPLKRFWKAVHLERQATGDYAVRLDARNLRTMAGKLLCLPGAKPLFAALVAHEWDGQDVMLKPHSLPLTSLASRALDALDTAGNRERLAVSLLSYLDTDTVLYHGTEPPQLVTLQQRHWMPLLAWVRDRYGLSLQPYDGILDGRQSDEVRDRLGAVVATFDAFKLAAFERAVLASKSYIIALALVEGFLSAEEAAACAHVEVQSQIDRWGEVEDSHDVDHAEIRSRLASASLVLS